MYGRRYGERTLTFEASGALRNSALILRDRETDSWWSIMTADAIGGPLEGTGLQELPEGRKTTWGAWKRQHPASRVLSVGGVEHDTSNPYDRYFNSEATFRNQPVADERLPAKTPIYAFQIDHPQSDPAIAFAVPHSVAEGGVLLSGSEAGHFYFHRPVGASVFAGTEAWWISPEVAARRTTPKAVAEWLASGGETLDKARRLPGIDTYWYTWVGEHSEARILGPD